MSSPVHQRSDRAEHQGLEHRNIQKIHPHAPILLVKLVKVFAAGNRMPANPN